MKLKLDSAEELAKFQAACAALLEAVQKKDALELEVKRADLLSKQNNYEASFELAFILVGHEFLKQCKIVREGCEVLKSFYVNEQT